MQEPLTRGLWGSEQGIQDQIMTLYDFVNDAIKWREDSLRQQAEGLQALRQGIQSSLDEIASQVRYLGTYEPDQKSEFEPDDDGKGS